MEIINIGSTLDILGYDKGLLTEEDAGNIKDIQRRIDEKANN